MGFFDLFKSRAPKASSPTPTAKPAAQSEASKQPVALSALLAKLREAREALEAKKPEQALKLYEQVLADGGDRADVLANVSAALGEYGLADSIVELVSPYYDALRHGPETGMNVLKAFLLLRDAYSARQVLDLLRALGRPELQERLDEAAEVIAKLEEAQNKGEIPGPITPLAEGEAPKVKMVTISKPIWFYGLESVSQQILPPKTGKTRSVTLVQLALPGLENPGLKMRQPEEQLGRLSRALPLWLAEILFHSPAYQPLAALGLFDDKRGANTYALITQELNAEQIRQLLDSSEERIDFLVTGALAFQVGTYELTLRLWEVKHLRERKTWTARWTVDTQDAELAKLREEFVSFMEGAPYPAGQGLSYPEAASAAWLETLGASLSLFLGDKGLLPKPLLTRAAADLEVAAQSASFGAVQSLAWITLAQRARKLGLVAESAPLPKLADHSVVHKALESLAR